MITSATFEVGVGILVRGAIKAEIRKMCFKLGLDCQVIEDKGIIDSLYTFKVIGDAEKINKLQNFIRSLETKN